MFENLIKPEFLILVPVLYAIGELIKKSPIKNWLIPFLLTGISIVMTTLHFIVSSNGSGLGVNIAAGVLQGIFIALTTVGANQYVRQIVNATKSSDEDKKDQDEKKKE